MSWQIPPQVEQDIIAGKATFRTHQVGYGGQSVLSVPTNSFVVIFGYDFSPAGGGLSSKNLVNADETLLKMNVHARAHPLDAHPIFQISGSSLLEKNKFLPVNKFYNPWIIKTPPGYSCLFVSPLNNADDRFSIISAIVDTDTYTQYINFPFIVNGDKYPELDTIVKKGTPYVQVIPFKRDNWRMKVKKITEKMKDESRFFQDLIINVYKNKFWSKKSWK